MEERGQNPFDPSIDESLRKLRDGFNRFAEVARAKLAEAGIDLTKADGRRMRTERSKAALLDACRDAMRQGNFRPSIAEVAAAARRSPRCVFDHFGSLEGLHRAAIDDQFVRAAIIGKMHRDAASMVEAAVFGRGA